MRGFILKDLYIMRKKLISILLMITCMMLIFSILAVVIHNTLDNDHIVGPGVIALTTAFCAFMWIYGFSTDILFFDERKKWNMYAASSEAGVRAAVGAKFTLCFIMYFTVYLLCRLEDIILSLIYNRQVDYSILYLGIIFAITLLIGQNLLFGFYFGAKYGSTMRIAATVLLFTIAVLYALFGNIEWIMGKDGITKKLEYLLTNLESPAVRESAAKLSGGLIALLCLIPHAIVASYYGFYRLACRFYTRGAMNYDK